MSVLHGHNFRGTERFEITRQLGEGGMGIVYEARDREHGATVALKALRFVSAHSIYRFKQEFRALQDLRHPNLVQLDELFELDGQWFFTMELVDGVDLLEHVRRCDDAGVRASFAQLARGLIALHGAHRVHRDLKPTNVMVARSGRVVILDFGLSIDVDGGHSSQREVVGTAAYMAPEQAASKRVGPAADWYSVGVMLYEALTQRQPFAGTPLQIFLDKQEREPAPVRSLRPDVPPDLDALCAALLRFDPAARPAGDAVLHRLGADATGTSLRAVAPRDPDHQPFVGRDRELAALRAAFDACRRGGGGALLVRGESGVGKSELVRRFVAALQADEPEVTVLCGRCYERESVPYKAFDGIADSLTRHLGGLSDPTVDALLPPDASLLGRLFPVLRRVEAIARGPGPALDHLDPQEQRARMFAALRALLSRMAARAPVVLVIDDFQWADADSSTLLVELLYPPDPPPLLLLGTARSERADMVDRFAAMTRPAGVAYRELELAPLSARATRELAGRLAPELAGDGEALGAIAAETAGHPLFVLEVVRHARAGGPRRATATRLDDALWARIERLPGPARELLETLCVAGAPISREVARHAMRQDYVEHESAASILRIAHLARTAGVRGTDSIEPYHDRVREAVVARLAAPRRRHHHERLAVALVRAGAGASAPQALVRHLEASGDRAAAAQRAAEAAQQAEQALAFDHAAELYRAVLRLGVVGAERARVQRQLADALAHAGRGAEAAEAYARAAADRDPATRLECRRLAAEQLLRSGHIERGLTEYQELLGQIGISLPRTPRRALASLLWCRLRLRLRGLRWRPVHESQIAIEELTRLDTYRAVGHGLGMVDNVRGADFQARSLLAALHTGESRRVMLAMAAEAIYVGSQGGRGLRRARALIERVQRMEAAFDDPVLHGWRSAAEGIVAYLEGRFLDAAEGLADAVRLFGATATGTAWEFNTTRMFRMFALKHVGRIKEIEPLYFQYVRDAERRGDRYIETSTLRYGTFLWLARGRPDEVRANLARASWVPPEGAFHLQHWFELEAQAELALYEGRAGELLPQLAPRLRALDSSMLLRIQIVRCLATWVRGRLALAAASEQGDARRLGEVRRRAAELRRERVPHAEVWADLLSAGAAFQAGDAAAAADHLRAAAELADARRLELTALAARYRLGRALGGDEGRELTAHSADAMRAAGVASPGRLAGVLVPGVCDRRRPTTGG